MADAGSKPAFDPNKPFAPADDKPAFDPSQPFQPADDSNQPGLLAQAGKATVNALPVIGGVVGGIVGTPADIIAGPMGSVAGAGIGAAAGSAAKNAINSYINPTEAPKSPSQYLTDPLKEGLIGAAGQGAGELAAPLISKAVGAGADALSGLAERKAVEATGATGNQVYKTFQPGSGRALLDQGIVKFGRNQPTIAEKTSEALQSAGQTIGDTIEHLSSKGATVDQADIVNSMRQRADALSGDPAQYKVADQLNALADRIEHTASAGGGNADIPLNAAEATKRGFQADANYMGGSRADLSVAKEAASIYQKAVEDSATKFDPDSAKIFQAAKSQYSILKPMADAAEKRAATLAQSPKGGMMDAVATGVGSAVAGTPGAIIAAPARRIVATRIAPSIAAGADTAAQIANKAKGLLSRGVPAAATASATGMSALPAPIPLMPGLVLPAAANPQRGSP